VKPHEKQLIEKIVRSCERSQRSPVPRRLQWCALRGRALVGAPPRTWSTLLRIISPYVGTHPLFRARVATGATTSTLQTESIPPLARVCAGISSALADLAREGKIPASCDAGEWAFRQWRHNFAVSLAAIRVEYLGTYACCWTLQKLLQMKSTQGKPWC